MNTAGAMLVVHEADDASAGQPCLVGERGDRKPYRHCIERGVQQVVAHWPAFALQSGRRLALLSMAMSVGLREGLWATRRC